MESFLSTCVHNLITNVGSDNREPCSDSVEYFHCDGILNQNKLKEILPEPAETAEYFEECTRQLAPVFLQAERLLSCLDTEDYGRQYDQVNTVLGNVQICRDVHALLKSDNPSDDLLALLLITATVERSLSYVFSSHTSTPSPSLLKDLLNNTELENILGPVLIQVSRCVIGPPISLNLRNITWHGFLVPGEIPKQYCYFLLLLSSNMAHFANHSLLGHREKHIFKCRSEYEELLRGITFDVSAILALLHNSGVFGVQYDTIELALRYYSSGRYGFAVTLILPQFEHALRRVFCEVNNCPHRVMTAEATTLYTTFDEMLDPVLPSGAENQLKEELGENFMDMIHDLLVYPDGPRVRDKLGHGEIDFYDFPEILVKVFLTSLKEYTRKYNSLFHPVSMVKKKLHDVVELFLTFRDSIKLSPDLQLRTANTVYFNEDHLRGMFLMRSELATKLYDQLFTTQELSVPREKVEEVLSSPMSHCRDIVQELLSGRIHTLYLYHRDTHSFDGRHNSASLRKSEPHISEIVCLLQHIVDEIHTVLRQTTDTLTDRQQQFSDHLLRSRQRDNLKKLINSCPFLHQSMLFVSVIVIWQLYNLESQKMTRTKTVKFLKMILQFTENLRTFTNKEKNKWKECIDLYINCLEKIETFHT